MKRFFIISGIAILLIVSGFFLLDHFLPQSTLSQSEKMKALENLLGRPAQLSPVPAPMWKTYKGKYLSVSYPSDASIAQQHILSPLVLENFSYTIPSQHLLITVLVKSLQGTFLDDSAVVVRESQSTLYHTSSNAKASCLTFVKDDDSPEESIFCPLAQQRIGSLVVSGTNEDEVTKYFSLILKTLSW